MNEDEREKWESVWAEESRAEQERDDIASETYGDENTKLNRN